MCKVNYATRPAYCLQQGPKNTSPRTRGIDPKKYSAVGREYVKEYVKSKDLVCGSNGKA